MAKSFDNLVSHIMSKASQKRAAERTTVLLREIQLANSASRPAAPRMMRFDRLTSISQFAWDFRQESQFNLDHIATTVPEPSAASRWPAPRRSRFFAGNEAAGVRVVSIERIICATRPIDRFA